MLYLYGPEVYPVTPAFASRVAPGSVISFRTKAGRCEAAFVVLATVHVATGDARVTAIDMLGCRGDHHGILVRGDDRCARPGYLTTMLSLVVQ